MPKDKLNIIILTTKGGQGLLSCSQAIKEEFEINQKYDCKPIVVDFFEIGNSTGRKLTGIYNFLLRNSLRFNSLFIKAIHKTRPDKLRLFYGQSIEAFNELKLKYNPDIIVITSEYIVSFFGYLKEKKLSDIFTSVANIDPGSQAVPLWFDSRLDLHLLPTNETLERYYDIGHDLNKAIVSGFAIRKRFLNNNFSKEEILREMGFDPSKKTILLTGSREGNIRLISLVNRILEHKDYQLIVITGNNKRMYEKLCLRHHGNKNIRIEKWVENIEKYYHIADLVLSKPGKQTMVECIATETPIVLLAYPAVMEQESGNISLVVQNEIGSVSRNDDETVSIIDSILYDYYKYNKISRNIKKFKQENIKTKTIVENILNAYQTYSEINVVGV